MKNVLLAIALLNGCVVIVGQTWQGNHDESKVGSYTLPDVLTSKSGKKVNTANEWQKTRRPEILRIYEESMYGPTPKVAIPTASKVVSVEPKALGGTAIRKEVTISFPGHDNGPAIHVLMYLPANAKKPVPAF